MKTEEKETWAVLARALALPQGSGVAGEFVYMPAGENVIVATVNGKPEEITVKVDSATAAALQRDLTRREASGIRPALDYNHEGGRASGWPTGFRWSEGVGVICDVEWTAAAVAAIRAGEWRYFSPEFNFDRKTGRVLGLRSVGPVGGLVNDPAFRAMPAVQARRAEADNTFPGKDAPGQPQPNQHNKMTRETIVAALSAAGILSETEAAADNAPALLASRLTALKEGDAVKAGLATAHQTALAAKEAEVTALRTELDTHKASVAAAAVEAAVQRRLRRRRLRRRRRSS